MHTGLAGKTLTSVHVEYTALLEFTDDYLLTLETEFVLATAAGSVRLVPEDYLDENFGLLSRLVGVAVTAADYDETGNLHVTFADGATITSGPDGHYEAWNVAARDGVTVVCLPSAGVMTWT